MHAHRIQALWVIESRRIVSATLLVWVSRRDLRLRHLGSPDLVAGNDCRALVPPVAVHPAEPGRNGHAALARDCSRQTASAFKRAAGGKTRFRRCCLQKLSS